MIPWYMWPCVVVIVLSPWMLYGCYLEHAAEPCDGGQGFDAEMPSSQSWVMESGGPASDICAGPVVAGECYADIHDVVSR